MIAENRVILKGKVSRKKPLRYTPNGYALFELTLAVPQEWLTKKNVGYFDVAFLGELAESHFEDFKVGDSVEIQGELWARIYKNRRGDQVAETKIIAKEFKK